MPLGMNSSAAVTTFGMAEMRRTTGVTRCFLTLQNISSPRIARPSSITVSSPSPMSKRTTIISSGVEKVLPVRNPTSLPGVPMYARAFRRRTAFLILRNCTLFSIFVHSPRSVDKEKSGILAAICDRISPEINMIAIVGILHRAILSG